MVLSFECRLRELTCEVDEGLNRDWGCHAVSLYHRNSLVFVDLVHGIQHPVVSQGALEVNVDLLWQHSESILVISYSHNFSKGTDVKIENLVKNIVQNVELGPFDAVLTLREPDPIQVRLGYGIGIVIILMLVEI